MSPWKVRMLLAVVALGSAIGLSATLAGQSGSGSSKSDIEWRFFGGDAGATDSSADPSADTPTEDASAGTDAGEA